MLNRLNQKFAELPKRWIVAYGIGTLAIVGLIDYLTGFDISMSFFYIGPVGLVTWYAGRQQGFILASLAGIVLFFLATFSTHVYSHPAILYWNLLLELAYYLVIVILISKVYTSIAFEKRLARTDPLTNIPNRLMFIEQLHSCFLFAERSKDPFSLAYIDVDNFKHINDTYGHAQGDSVLHALAAILCTHLRRTDTVARLGGDEFALLLPNTGSAGARELIYKIQPSIQEVFQIYPFTITISIGVVTFETLPATYSEAIKVADALMYTVKQNGRNAVRFSVFNNLDTSIS